jgi:ubiquinone/menaquinone biosynthesis C-methylase UbiE
VNHQDHVHLLRKGVSEAGGIWADLGCGEGAFTLALAELIGPTGTIYAVDKNAGALRQLERTMHAMFPDITLVCLSADFTRPLDLPLLDGLVMANSLHYVRKKDVLLQRVHGYLRPGGRMLLVEYNADVGNPWVPYPLSYETWSELASRNGFTQTQLLEKVPSRFLREMYAAASLTPNSASR